MKIIEVISDTNIGGAGILLINRLKNTDFEKYSVLTVIPPKSALEQRLSQINAPYLIARVAGDRSFDVWAIPKYVRIFCRERPDVVNCHGVMSARIAAKLCRVPVKICTRHCVFPVKRRERLFAAFSKRISDAFIAVAHSARQNLVDMGIDSDRIYVIINGAQGLKRLCESEKESLRQGLGIDKDTVVIGFCARLEKCKGHAAFLAAMRKLCDLDVCALIIGDGSQREALEKTCEQYGLCGRVIFCGFVEDVTPLMNVVDVNINCSIGTETSSLALSEGMSLGIPAVVSDYGGNPYMVKDGENGLVYKQGDSEALADKIRLLVKDKGLRNKMGEAAYRRFFEELNAKRMTEKTYTLYGDLYAKCRGSVTR